MAKKSKLSTNKMMRTIFYSMNQCDILLKGDLFVICKPNLHNSQSHGASHITAPVSPLAPAGQDGRFKAKDIEKCQFMDILDQEFRAVSWNRT